MTQATPLPAPAALLPAVVAAARDAGALLRAEFHRPGGPRGAGGHAPVDAEVEALLRARLLALHPAGWRGEETPPAPGVADTWVVDPQDGTRAFLAGRRGASVSVALVRDGRPVLGVVFAPTAPDDRGDLFAWVEGAPLTRNDAPVAALPAGGEPGGETVVALNEHAADYAEANHARLAPMRVLAVPSIAYRLALAAAGDVDAAVSLTGGLAPWDIAGGHALLRGAGGTLAQLDGRPLAHRPGAAFRGCIGGHAAAVRDLAARGLAASPAAVRRPRHPARPAAPASVPARLDRAQGCLLGLLAGDALGSAVEFESAARIAARFPDGVRDLRPGGTWGLIAGQPTDDGEMALALARALVAAGGFDAGAAAAAYVAWLRSGPFDIGTTTRRGIAALAAGRPATSASESNGALMRAAPIGILAAGRPARAAALGAADAALTHPAPLCRAASAAFCAAVAVGVAGGDPESMWVAAHAACPEDAAGARVRACLLTARDGPPADFQRHMGHLPIALCNAVFRLVAGQPLEDALIETVAAGGDTDTNAAICGALLGAAQGRVAVPPRWRRLVLTCRPVPAPEIRHPRPAACWPDDALSLAEALLAAGRC